MELKKAVKYMNAQIEGLEKAVYMFDNVIKPRAEADKQILKKMRESSLKMQVLQEKAEKGEEISQDEIYSCVPESFR